MEDIETPSNTLIFDEMGGEQLRQSESFREKLKLFDQHLIEMRIGKCRSIVNHGIAEGYTQPMEKDE